jgi:pimeloyl-ACP methyl ester carboxylesterase
MILGMKAIRPPALLATAALILTACAGQGGQRSAAASSPSVAASAATASSGPAVEAGSVEIDDGRSLYRVCRGEGSPTVILESGDGAAAGQWDQVMTQIAEVTTVCAYDRGGLRRSDAVTGCRHLVDLTGDLAQLLEAADIPGPYVLVGTSGGGYITAGFATEHPADVAGIVLLDVFRPFTDPPPDLIADTACDAPGNDEHRDYLAVEHEAWDARVEIGDIPVTIVTVEYENPEHIDEVENIEGQQGWLVLSPRAEQVVVQTAHDIANDAPEIVIREITRVIEAARASGSVDY